MASEHFHPEMLTAGTKLANLVEESISKVKALLPQTLSSVILLAISGGPAGLIALGLTAAQAYEVYESFTNSYEEIVSEAKKKAKEWNKEHIPDYQNRIRSASGSQKIELRVELLQTVAQDAMIRSEELATGVKTELSNTLENIKSEITSGTEAAQNAAHYLDASEVSALLSDFTISHFWDTGIEDSTNKSAEGFQTKIEQFSTSLMQIARNIEQVDSEGAEGFNTIMNQTKVNWGAAK